jgi:hypothetical protein
MNSEASTNVPHYTWRGRRSPIGPWKAYDGRCLTATSPTDMQSPASTRRPILTPDLCVLLLLVAEALLFLSNWLAWPVRHKGYAVLTCVAVVGVGMVLMLFWFVVALLFQRRFQFGIRTLLMLTVAVALPFSWLAMKHLDGLRQLRWLDLSGTRATDAGLLHLAGLSCIQALCSNTTYCAQSCEVLL